MASSCTIPIPASTYLCPWYGFEGRTWHLGSYGLWVDAEGKTSECFGVDWGCEWWVFWAREYLEQSCLLPGRAKGRHVKSFLIWNFSWNKRQWYRFTFHDSGYGWMIRKIDWTMPFFVKRKVPINTRSSFSRHRKQNLSSLNVLEGNWCTG